MTMTRRAFALSALAGAIICVGRERSRSEAVRTITRSLKRAGIENVEISDKLVSNVYTVDEFVFYLVEGML